MLTDVSILHRADAASYPKNTQNIVIIAFYTSSHLLRGDPNYLHLNLFFINRFVMVNNCFCLCICEEDTPRHLLAAYMCDADAVKQAIVPEFVILISRARSSRCRNKAIETDGV